MSTRKAHSQMTCSPERSPVRQQPIRYPRLAKIALIGTEPGLGTSSLTQRTRIDQPSAKMRLSGPPGGDEWGVFRSRAGISRLGLSFIRDARNRFCVLGGFFVERASDTDLSPDMVE